MTATNLILMSQVVLVLLVSASFFLPATSSILSTRPSTFYSRPIQQHSLGTDYPTNITGIVQGYGYAIEEHIARTSDGWDLVVFRLGQSQTGNNTAPPRSKGVVFFQHGITDCAVGSVLNSPKEAFPFIFVDQGFDVWLGNVRGNGYSMTYLNYTTHDDEFWDFTWDEMAQIDLPTQINFVLEQTGAATLSYIGHSQGTTMAFAGFIFDPALAEKVNLYIALAPISYIGHTSSLLLKTLADINTQDILEALGVQEFDVPSAIDKFLPGICKVFPPECEFSLSLVCGPTTYLNDTRLAYYGHYEPNPTSVKNIVHWSQSVKNSTFSMYNYGSASENMQHYNQTTPPPYDFADFPPALNVAFFSGTQDYLADPADVEYMLSLLPTAPVLNHVEPHYAHLDPLLGVNAYQLIYPLMTSLLEQYNPSPP